MRKFFTVISYINKKSIRRSKTLFFTEMILLLLNAFVMSLTIYSQQYFFDGITDHLHGDSGRQRVIYGLIIFIAINILSYIIGSLCEFFPQMISSGLRIVLRQELQDKVSNYPYINFEDTEFLNRLNKAEEGRYNTVGLYYIVRQLLFFYIPYFVFVSVFLSSINIFIVIGIWFIFTPVIISHVIHIKMYTKLEDEVAPIRRMSNHFADCITSRCYFKETRLYGAVAFFYRKFENSFKKQLDKNYKTDMKVCCIDSVIRASISVFYCGILLLMFFLLMKRKLTVGSFIAINTSISTVFSMTEDLVYNKIGYISTQLGSIYNYYDLITDKLPQKKSAVSKVSGDIVLKDVSFRYPYTQKNALQNVSLTLKEGETIAVVGENGSGKSTLSKIMMGLIEPVSGDVLYGHNSIKEISDDILYSHISAIFQNFNKYSIKL